MKNVPFVSDKNWFRVSNGGREEKKYASQFPEQERGKKISVNCSCVHMDADAYFCVLYWIPNTPFTSTLFSISLPSFFFFHVTTAAHLGGEEEGGGNARAHLLPEREKKPIFFSFGCTFELVEVLLVDPVAAVAGHDGAGGGGGAVAATAVVGQAVGAVGGAVLVGGGGDQLGAVVLLDGAGAALVLGGRGGLLLHRGHLAAGAAAAAAVHGGAAAAVVPLLLDGAGGRHPLLRSSCRCCRRLPEVFLCRRRCGSAVVPSQRLRLGLEPEAVPVVAACGVRHDARARFEWALKAQGGTKNYLVCHFFTDSSSPGLHLGTGS